jgi:2-dehydro-3-deoxyphosphooctonate aldolase (KDO 8-P synthase)
MSRIVHVGSVAIGNDLPFALIAGPCQIESRGHALEVAAALREMSAATGVPLIYKSSFDKANRTSVSAARGIGIGEGLGILAEVRETTGLPTLTDVHTAEQWHRGAGGHVLQTPPVPPDRPAVRRRRDHSRSTLRRASSSHPGTWPTSRRSLHRQPQHPARRAARASPQHAGQRFRSLPIMARTGYPVVFDAHSVQQPGGRAPHPAAASSPRCWHAPRWRSASPRCSSKRIPILTRAERWPQHERCARCRH